MFSLRKLLETMVQLREELGKYTEVRIEGPVEFHIVGIIECNPPGYTEQESPPEGTPFMGFHEDADALTGTGISIDDFIEVLRRRIDEANMYDDMYFNRFDPDAPEVRIAGWWRGKAAILDGVYVEEGERPYEVWLTVKVVPDERRWRKVL